jgi:hypothetical protein
MADLLNTIQTEYYGDNVRWFIGVVEDNKTDPEQLGRVRVRIFGLHNPYLDEVPTDKLPWATVLIPGHFGGVSGIGRSPTGIEQGCWVFGMFMDGKHSQNPVVFGTIPKRELPSGKDITPEKKIQPTKIESVIGQAPTIQTGTTISVNTATENIVFDMAKQDGMTDEAAAVMAAYIKSQEGTI